MDRRKVLASSVTASALAGGALGTSGIAAQETVRQGREYYELRVFELRRGRQRDALNEFLSKAWLPAMNQIGSRPIGVFDVMVGPASPSIYALIPYQSLESFATVSARLAADIDYQKSGAAVIAAPATEPAYGRVESSLMVAFEGMPEIQPPHFGARQADRIFELRTYESHSKKANQKKIAMFNQGEIAIFRRTGLQPVFFGETLVGRNCPQLTYMLTFDSMESHGANWQKFATDPEWKKLSTTPGYTDAEIVSNISNLFLRPTAYSQV